MKNILLVEDNEIISKGLKYSLEQEKFSVTVAKKFEIATKLLEENQTKDINMQYDLVILDIMLPDGNGYDLCKIIKSEYEELPVIFLTAKDEENNVVQGFNLGADEYIIKPFRSRELISRINNVLRRYGKNADKIQSGNITIDLNGSRVYTNNEEIIFTALEYKILSLLFINKGKTVTRNKILEKIWDLSEKYVNDNTLTVYIKRIREKLGNDDVIKTIKGIGYRVD